VRPSWDEWALGIAEAVATRADCTRAQVGAVILSKRNRVIGQGYNGLPAGVPGCATAGNCPRGRLSVEACARDSDYSNCAATHAERNAIEDALDKGIDAQELQAATLYVTRKPCPACTTLITAVGIRRVVVEREEIGNQCSPPEGPLRFMLNRAVNSRG
jgi:dCMP deaminase